MPYSDNSEIKREFFIGASTAAGYESCCDDIFKKARKIYIIKGAPGTGKSQLMKKIAAKAAEDGYSAELFYCSSDADSLDAVYIPETGICITDGTAPHVKETDIPGSRDEILNLGEFWDSKKLEKNGETILRLMKEKQKLYSAVFDKLNLCGKLCRQSKDILSAASDAEKLDSAARRIVKGFGKPAESSDIIYRQLESVGMTGTRRLDTFGKLCEKRFYISGRYNSSVLFFDALLRAAKEVGQSVWISRSPLCGMNVNALYFPAANVSVTNAGSENSDADLQNVKIINMERFISSKAIRESKNRLKLLSGFGGDISSEIENNFAKIKKLHFELEGIYGGAMDFEKVDKYSKKVLKTIF